MIFVKSCSDSCNDGIFDTKDEYLEWAEDADCFFKLLNTEEHQEMQRQVYVVEKEFMRIKKKDNTYTSIPNIKIYENGEVISITKLFEKYW